MASEDLNKLFAAAIDFARTMLKSHGEFIPFGVSLDDSGAIALVAGDVGSEHPASQDVIALLQAAFARSASDRAIRAAGVCLNARVVPPSATAKTDAICVRLAHTSGEALDVYLPYRTKLLGGHRFGEVFATKGTEFRLAEP